MKNHRKNYIEDFILMTPSFVLVFSITAYVLVNTFVESLGIIPELFLREVSFDHFRKLFADGIFVEGMVFSLKIASLSGFLSTLAGVYLAYELAKGSHSKKVLWYRYPIILSYIAAALLIYNTYSTRGLLYHILLLFGVDVGGLEIIYASSGLAVVLLNLFKGIPFVAFSVYPIFVKVDGKYRETARNLGCNRSSYVYRILLPMAKHAILTSFLILFNYNLFSYEGFYFLGPSRPFSVGVMAYNAYIHPDLSMRPYAMAINFVMMFISLLLCLVFYKSLKGSKKGGDL